MKNNYKIFLFLFLLLSGNSICYSKKFEVKNIIHDLKDRTATQSPVLDSNLEMCALIKLSFPHVDDKVISGDQITKKEYHGNEWYIYMPPGTFKFFIKYPGYEDLEVDMSKQLKKGVEAGQTYRVTIPYGDDVVSAVPIATPVVVTGQLPTQRATGSTNPYVSSNSSVASTSTVKSKKESLIKKNDFYIQAGYNIIGLSGLNIGIGGYISNFNIEANYLLGLSKSENIYWDNTSGDNMPIPTTYSPMGCNLKIGYGIKLGDRFRITPRLGMEYVALHEKAPTKVANNANALDMPIGLKVDFGIVEHFGISLEPSYLIGMNKSEGYNALSDISDKIKGYADGFGLNISLYCNF